MRRGVNARATSLRSFVCSGGSIMIIIGMPYGSSDMISSMIPWLDTNDSWSSRPRSTSSYRLKRPEVELLVVVHGRLVTQALPDRVRIGVDLVVVGVVVDVGDGHTAGYLVSTLARPHRPRGKRNHARSGVVVIGQARTTCRRACTDWYKRPRFGMIRLENIVSRCLAPPGAG